jgi:methylglutaconyl-CoA hydratase
MPKQSPVLLDLISLSNESAAHLAVVTLNRADFANAFDQEMIEKMQAIFEQIHADSSIRALLIQGAGRNFSAGADLNWMKKSKTFSYEKNLQDAGELQSMFMSLDRIKCPIISVVHGAAYGGAVGLAACADIVIVSKNVRFCLSEVKLGLLPAVILPYLARRINSGALRRAMLTARVIDAGSAEAMGLADIVVDQADLESTVRRETNLILNNAPEAIKKIKSLFVTVRDDASAQYDAAQKAIADARVSSEGQLGLASFFTKSITPWSLELPDEWKLVNDQD